MIEVKDNGDGTMDVSWDPDDPIESALNGLDEEAFLKMLQEQLMAYNVAGNTAPGSIVEHPETSHEQISEEN